MGSVNGPFDNMIPLTPEGVHRTLMRFFPAKNDDVPSDYAEESTELRDFGITTEEQLLDLGQSHTEPEPLVISGRMT